MQMFTNKQMFEPIWAVDVGRPGKGSRDACKAGFHGNFDAVFHGPPRERILQPVREKIQLPDVEFTMAKNLCDE